MTTKLITGTCLQLLRRYDHKSESQRAALLDDVSDITHLSAKSCSCNYFIRTRLVNFTKNRIFTCESFKKSCDLLGPCVISTRINFLLISLISFVIGQQVDLRVGKFLFMPV